MNNIIFINIYFLVFTFFLVHKIEAQKDATILNDSINDNGWDWHKPENVCKRHKHYAVVILARECSKGWKTLDKLFRIRKYSDGELNNCITKWKLIKEEDIRKEVKSKLREQNKHGRCFRNNAYLKNEVCVRYRYGDSLKKIYSIFKSSELPKVDIDYFIKSGCPLLPVSHSLARMICAMKGDISGDRNSILKKFVHYEPKGLNAAWDACKLSQQQKANICKNKMFGYQLNFINKLFKNYNPQTIKKVYDSCVIKVSKKDKDLICKMRIHQSILELYHKKYGKKKVDEIVGQC